MSYLLALCCVLPKVVEKKRRECQFIRPKIRTKRYPKVVARPPLAPDCAPVTRQLASGKSTCPNVLLLRCAALNHRPPQLFVNVRCSLTNQEPASPCGAARRCSSPRPLPRCSPRPSASSEDYIGRCSYTAARLQPAICGTPRLTRLVTGPPSMLRKRAAKATGRRRGYQQARGRR
jgi:hypothetical protein